MSAPGNATGVSYDPDSNTNTYTDNTDYGNGADSSEETIPAVCGDGIMDGAEACDDGNTTPSDGCSATCTIETGFICSGIPSGCVPGISYEGVDYPLVTIGTQTWLQKNLNVGTRIDSTDSQTDNSTVEKYCYGNDPVNCDTYGGMYRWDEAPRAFMSRPIPNGTP